jgi:hypothetical protein
MALQKCHECGNDVSSEAKSCPKCGAAVKSKSNAFKVVIGVLLVLCAFAYSLSDDKKDNKKAEMSESTQPSMLSPAPIVTNDVTPVETTNAQTGIDPAETRCNIIECASGMKIKTYAKKDDPFYACETRALSDYTNYVIGIAAITVALTGHLPNVSQDTGDIEQTGKSKIVLDNLRSSAGVASFDEAMIHCKNGKNSTQLMVINNPKDGVSLWASNEKTKELFWIPKAHANIIK